MNKFLIAITAFVICAASVNAQPTRPLPTKLDDFGLSTFYENRITTELIECSPSSNIYTRIDILRNYGVPRFGIITDCSSQTLDTVWYLPNTISRPTSGMIATPLFTDTAITIWWKEGQPTVQIMDVLTGVIVLNETIQGQSASMFAANITDIGLADSTTISFTGEGITPVKDSNSGETINYSSLPNGLYWIYIVDENNLVWYMQTFRKGM